MNGEQFALDRFEKSVTRMRALQIARRLGQQPIELSELRAAESEVDANCIEARKYLAGLERRTVPAPTPDTADLPPVPLPEPMDDIDLPPVPPLPIDQFTIPEVPPLEVPPMPAIDEDEQPAKRGRRRGGQHGGS